MVKAGDANARAQPAAEPLRQRGGRNAHPLPQCEGPADRQGQLSAGAEAGMRRQYSQEPKVQRFSTAAVGSKKAPGELLRVRSRHALPARWP